MSAIDWLSLEKFYEHGFDRGVLYLADSSGVAWRGLVAIDELDSDSTENFTYFDSKRRAILQSSGGYSAVLSAYMYPEEFVEYTGIGNDYVGNQTRPNFGLSYRTAHGSGYKIHLIYGARVSPVNIHRQSESETPAPTKMSWGVTTTPVSIPWSNPGSHLIVDATTARYPAAVEALELILYGSESADPRFPSPEEIVELFESYVIFRVTYNGDGTLTIEGPDEMIHSAGAGELEIISPSLAYYDENTISISSY